MGFFSAKNVFTTRNLTVMALMVALKVVLSFFSIYITPTFRILSFGYLPGAIVSLLYGPLAGLGFGFVADIVGYVVKPVGAYLPFYALSEMVANFIYALFLYRRPLTVWRVALAQISVTVIVIFGMGFLWNSLLFGGTASTFYTGGRFLSNLINLPIYVALIVLLGRLSLRMTKKQAPANRL